jgi:CheY-like chemotaxis protein
MDGITATSACRQLYHLKNLPIIVITAELGEDIQKQALIAGANAVISKPAPASEILAAVRNSINY